MGCACVGARRLCNVCSARSFRCALLVAARVLEGAISQPFFTHFPGMVCDQPTPDTATPMTFTGYGLSYNGVPLAEMNGPGSTLVGRPGGWALGVLGGFNRPHLQC
jgi:hypothetical protein